MIDQKIINKINARYKSLVERQTQFGAGMYREQFKEIVRANNIGTQGGMISAAKINKLSEAQQNTIMNALKPFLGKETTAAGAKEALRANKKSVANAFKNSYNIDVSKMNDDEYAEMWERIRQLSEQYTGLDYDNSVTSVVTEMYQNQEAYDYELDEIFDMLMQEDNAGDAISLLRDLDKSGFVFWS